MEADIEDSYNYFVTQQETPSGLELSPWPGMNLPELMDSRPSPSKLRKRSFEKWLTTSIIVLSGLAIFKPGVYTSKVATVPLPYHKSTRRSKMFFPDALTQTSTTNWRRQISSLSPTSLRRLTSKDNLVEEKPIISSSTINKSPRFTSIVRSKESRSR